MSPYENQDKPDNGRRKTKYTRALMVQILEQVGNGDFLIVACRDAGVRYETILGWSEASAVIAAALARAYEACGAAQVAAMHQIADTRVPGLAELEQALADGQAMNGRELERLDLLRQLEETRQKRDKLRIYVREKTLAVIGGNKFAQRTILAGDPNNPLMPKTKSLSEYTEAELMAAISAEQQRDPEGESR